MKKLVVAALIVIAAVTNADARYLGTLTSGAPVEIQLGTSIANGTPTAGTILWVKGKSLALVGTLTVAGGGQTQTLVTPKVPKNVTRLIVLVDLPPGGSVLVKVSQGAVYKYEEPVTDSGYGGIRFVLDVLPAP